jgi:acetyl esterase/lipase
MRPRILIVAILLVALVGFAAVRGNRRLPSDGTPESPEAQLEGGIRRLDLRFPCEASKCAGWLYLPAGNTPPPVVVMAHGFAGTRDVGLPAIARRFARAGIAAFVFDYRSFGASGGLPRQIVDPWHQLDDWRAALKFARARPDVDGKRIAVWGSSLGGGHALLIAAEDQNLRAVVAQAPLVDTSLEGDATFYGIGWIARLLLTAWWDILCSAFSANPVTIPAIAPGDGFGMIVDDGAYAASKARRPGLNVQEQRCRTLDLDVR